MKGRKNPFPGVTRVVDRHGKVRWRFRDRKSGYTTYVHGDYGSAEWRTEYETARDGAKAPPTSRTPRGSLSWLIEQYLGSLRFKNLSVSRKRSIRLELDWLRQTAGKYHYSEIEVRHIEAIMAKKTGPVAANTVKKNMSMLFNFAARKLSYKGSNPARHAERMKTNPDGYHTWTDTEVDRFLHAHGPGTKPRLVLLLALNTGMSRQDLARVGWQHVKDGRIVYTRGKTDVPAMLPILPALAEELQRIPKDRMLFITQAHRDKPYAVASLGNWFRDQCNEAGVPGSLHGLRKAGATRLADAGATEWEIAAYLAHTDTTQAKVYTKKASRSRLADSGFAKLTGSNVSNLPKRLDKNGGKTND